MNRRTVLSMVLVGLLGFAQAQNNSNDMRMAPQFARVLTDADSDQAQSLFELMEQLCQEYSIDRDRLYNTGQSMGGMFALSTNIARPDMFAASYLVACQWDTKEFYKFAKKPMWIVVAEGDRRPIPECRRAVRLGRQLVLRSLRHSGMVAI